MYTVEVNGYGAEMTVGTVTETQFNFWYERHDEEIHAHLFWDPYEADEDDEYPNPCTDPEAPEHLGHWFELDDIEHCNGAFLENCKVTVYDQNGETVFETDEPKLDNATLTDTDEIEGFYIKAWSSEKGNFFTGEINTEEFDVSKLRFYGTKIDEDFFLTNIEYANEDIDNEGGDTIGKGYDYEFIES